MHLIPVKDIPPDQLYQTLLPIARSKGLALFRVGRVWRLIRQDGTLELQGTSGKIAKRLGFIGRWELDVGRPTSIAEILTKNARRKAEAKT